MQEYLRLCVSGVFNEYKFTILNEWSQQSNQHQHSRKSVVTDNLKSILLTELEDYRDEYLRLFVSGVYNGHKFTILNEWSQY